MRRAKLITLFLVVAMTVTTAGAFACTGLYVGKDASADGTTIVGRSEDQGTGIYGKMFKVQPRVKEKGRYYVDEGEEQEGFKVALPETTYKYTYVPDSSDLGDGQYPGTCTNEYGLAVVGTVSASPSAEYEALDPYVHPGLREAILPGLIACQCKTARGAAERLAQLTDKYGSEEGNILFFVDKKEAWLFESYGGHTYAAMKMPTDKVAVFGNQFMIDVVDKNDKENYIFSKNLFETIDKVGAVMEDGKYNLVKSISDSPREEYSNMRTWMGHKLLAPSTVGEYSDSEFYPLFYAPDKKVQLEQVMDLFRNRYEDTPYDMMLPENAGRRPIGVTRSSQVHIIQTINDLPKETCQLQWLAMGNAEHSVFVPAFSGITNTHKAYQVDGSKAYKSESFYDSTKRICSIAESDREFLSQGVKDYWKLQEKMMIKSTKSQIKKIKEAYGKSKDDGRKYVTKLSKKYADKQYKNTEPLFNELFWLATSNQNDRPDNERKEHFVANTKLEEYAKFAGYKVSKNKKGTKYTLTKKGVKYVVAEGKDVCKVTKDGKTSDITLTHAPFIENDTLYAPVDFVKTL